MDGRVGSGDDGVCEVCEGVLQGQDEFYEKVSVRGRRGFGALPCFFFWFSQINLPEN